MASDLENTFEQWISPSGEVRDVPSQNVWWVKEQGWSPASPEQIAVQDRINYFKNTSGLEGAAVGTTAALSSAAQGLTFGAFNPLLEKFAPETAQTAKEIEAASPTAAELGSYAGIAGSLLAPVGEIIAPLGLAAKGGVEAALTGTAQAVSPLTKIAGTAAQLGTEGLAYAAPQAAALTIAGRPEEAAESLLMSGGMSALLGAAGQTAIEGAKGVGALTGKLGQKIPTNLKTIAKERLAEARENEIFKAVGGQKSIRNDPRLFRTAEDFSEFVNYVDKNILSKGWFHSSAALKEDALAAMRETGQKMGNVLTTLDDAGHRVSQVGLVKRLEEARDALPKGHTGNIGRKVYNNIIADVKNLDTSVNTISGELESTFTTVKDLKVSLADAYAKKKTARLESATIYKQAERNIDSFIMDEMDRAGQGVPQWLSDLTPEQLTELGVPLPVSNLNYGALKNEYKNLARLQQPLDNLINIGANKTIGLGDTLFANIGGILGSSVGGVTGGIAGAALGYIVSEARDMYGSQAMVKALNTLNNASSSKVQAITTAAKQLVEKTTPAAQVTQRFAKKVAPALIAQSQLKTLQELGDDNDKNIAADKIISHLQNIVNNPDAALKALPVVTEQYGNTDSMNLQALLQAQVAAKMLLDMAPQQQLRSSPFEEKPGYSRSELDDFQTALNVAMNPLIVLDELAKGTLDSTSVDVVKKLYPYLYAEAQSKILQKAAESPDAATNSAGKKLSLSLFFGKEVDSLYQPSHVQLLQQSYAQKQNNPKPTNRKVSQDLLTVGQQLENR